MGIRFQIKNVQWYIYRPINVLSGLRNDEMSYPSDLTDDEWEIIRSNFEYENGYGNRRVHSIQVMINAINYGVKTGCLRRQIPNDFLHWKSVYSYYARLCKKGIWEKALDN